MDSSHRIIRRYKEQRGSNAMPLLLYKFMSFGSPYFGISIDELLYNSKVYLSHRNDLNDPFEMRSIIGAPDESASERLKQHALEAARKQGIEASADEVERLLKRTPQELHDLFGQTFERQMDSMGIYSLSEEIENPLMWAHYANAHQGMCIAFHGFRQDFQFRGALPVLYNEHYPTIDLLESNDILEFGPLSKGKPWAYEREWRIANQEAARTYYELDNRSIAALILGLRASDSSELEVMRRLGLRSKLGLPPIAVFRAIQPKDRYELLFQEIHPEKGPVFETFTAALSHCHARALTPRL